MVPGFQKSCASRLVWLVGLASLICLQASAPGVRAEDARSYSAITAEIRQIFRQQAQARTPEEIEFTVGSLCLLFEELRLDRRRESSPTLTSVWLQVRSRLVSIRDDWRRQMRRAGWTWRDLGGPSQILSGVPSPDAFPQLPGRKSGVATASEPNLPTSGDATRLDEGFRLSASIAWGMEWELETTLIQLARRDPLIPTTSGSAPPQTSDQPSGPSRNRPPYSPPHARGGGAVDDYGPLLVDLITRTIEPTHWDTHGGPGTVYYYRPLRALVIRASAEVHHDVGRTLQAIRKAGE